MSTKRVKLNETSEQFYARCAAEIQFLIEQKADVYVIRKLARRLATYGINYLSIRER
jgi:hypothetical protein